LVDVTLPVAYIDDGTNQTRFPLLAPVQVGLASEFPAKVTIGDYLRDTEDITSSWIEGDFQGGLLTYRADVSKTQNRAWDSSLDTRYERQVTLLPYAHTAAPDTSGGDAIGAAAQIRAGAEYGAVGSAALYAAWDTKIRTWNPASGHWVTPSGYVAATHDLVANATDCCVLRAYNGSSYSDYLVFCSGSGYLSYNGTTWTRTTGNGSTIPKAKYLTEWDGKLWAIDDQNKLWSLTDLSGTSWDATQGTVPVQSGEVTALLVFFDNNNNAVLTATTHTGVWRYDASNKLWTKARMDFPRHPSGCKGPIVYRGDLYLPVGTSVYQFTGDTVRPVGLDQEWGLPSPYQGDIVGLVDVYNWLGAGLTSTGVPDTITTYLGGGDWDATTFPASVGKSAIFLWTGSGWHVLWTSATANTTATGISWLRLVTTDNQVRLWWGANNTAYYITLPRGIFNPREVSNWEFASSGELITPWFDGGWSEQRKVAIEVRVRGMNLSTTEKIVLYYATKDDTDTWNTLGTLDSTTDDSTGELAILMWPASTSTDTRGLPNKNIRFKVAMQRGSDVTMSPVMLYLALRYVKRPRALFTYSFTIDLSKDHDGLTPTQLRQRALDALNAEALLTLAFRISEQEIVQKKVAIVRWQETAYLDGETSVINVACTEL